MASMVNHEVVVAFRRFTSTVSLALVLAVSVGHAENLDSARYRRCTTQIDKNPQAALEAARSWNGEGGGAPAKHCEALALLSLGHADQAAGALQKLAQNGGGSFSADLLARLFDQAGNAWIVSGETQAAITAFSAALQVAGSSELTAALNASLYADRANAYLLQNSTSAAKRDLDRAIALAPTPQALSARARLKLDVKDSQGASVDIEHALQLDPSFAEAFLERGRLGVHLGDFQRARGDFLAAAMLDKDGPIAEAAKTELARLDLDVNR